jgi:Protein of unknwon function (DUF3008)
MPAVSQAQQRLFGMALSLKRGQSSSGSTEVRRLADQMSEDDLHDFAATKRKGLPKRKRKKVQKAVLTTERRKKLKKKTFGLPGEKKYPMPDRAHAANAKARATQQLNRGNLSPAQAAKIRAKANKMLKGLAALNLMLAVRLAQER